LPLMMTRPDDQSERIHQGRSLRPCHWQTDGWMHGSRYQVRGLRALWYRWLPRGCAPHLPGLVLVPSTFQSTMWVWRMGCAWCLALALTMRTDVFPSLLVSIVSS